MKRYKKGVHKAARDPFKARMYFVAGVFAIFFTAIVVRAFDLQILDGKELKARAARQHQKTISLQSKRGDIYDRNSRELAVSIEVDSVYARPPKLDSVKDASRVLAPLLGLTRSEIEKKLGGGNFVWLKRQVDLTEAQRKVIEEIEGVGIVKESRRYYPNRQLASHVVGFTGLDSNGLEGVERYYDTALKGAAAKLTSEKDAMGRVLLYQDVDKQVPVQGDVVELTIDKTIQYIAEKELKKAIDSTRADGGVALVMNPATGEILAMATEPSFDPNDIKGLKRGSGRNRAITDSYEPGSIFKLFLIAAALDEKVIKTTDNFFCENGSYRVLNRTFHDHDSHGWLSVPEILKVSSNICSAKIGERLGKAQLYRYLQDFGFGSKTGIDLPGEATGSLQHYRNWSGVSLHTISFGQGVSATGIQLVNALSSIANGGFLMRPYIVKSIRDRNGNLISETTPAIVKRIISEDTAKKMTEMMIGVTTQGGTGTKAAIGEFEVAGKTGTAQKPDFKRGGYSKDFMASFFGFVPARSPRLAILVSVDSPKGPDHFGGSVAGPAFREIALQSLAYMGVFNEKTSGPRMEAAKPARPARSPDASIGEEAKDATQGADEGLVPDLTGRTIREVLRIARERSFEVDITGSGRVASQRPAPGEDIPGDGRVAVHFQ